MKKFIIKRNDGGISVGQLIEGELNDAVSKWQESYPVKSSYHQFEERFPTNDDDGYFHDAYDHSQESGVFIHMDKAKLIHLNELRKLRHQKFINLGFPNRINPKVEDSIVDEETKLKLKELRDFPQNLDLSKVKDHVELRNIIPDCLK